MNSKNILFIVLVALWLFSSSYLQWSLQSKNIQIAVLNEQLSHLKEKITISDSIININYKIIDSIKAEIDTIYLTRTIIQQGANEKERNAVKLPLDDKIKLLSRNLQKSYQNSHR